MSVRSALRLVLEAVAAAAVVGTAATRSSLPRLERRTRMSEFAHLVIGAVGAGMVGVALAHHAWDAAAWLFAANVVLHAYPIMLQRVVRARLHRIPQPSDTGVRKTAPGSSSRR